MVKKVWIQAIRAGFTVYPDYLYCNWLMLEIRGSLAYSTMITMTSEIDDHDTLIIGSVDCHLTVIKN